MRGEIIIEVRIRRDEYGRVSSIHDLQGEEDRKTVLSWPSGGLNEVAFALLSEAVKREAIVDVGLQATHDPTFLNKLKTGDAAKESAVSELSKILCAGIAVTVSRLAENAIRGALEQYTADMPPAVDPVSV